ncbi:hypothetical protein [Sinorhizobium meliloti]|uniref:hypothetical protein n=1 Tax=Rhizobium meliloti TaxID=382 RepID=UPI001389C202|nr:hypothetical protein [Sinorhizobium meliloti]
MPGARRNILVMLHVVSEVAPARREGFGTRLARTTIEGQFGGEIVGSVTPKGSLSLTLASYDSIADLEPGIGQQLGVTAGPPRSTQTISSMSPQSRHSRST